MWHAFHFPIEKKILAMVSTIFNYFQFWFKKRKFSFTAADYAQAEAFTLTYFGYVIHGGTKLTFKLLSAWNLLYYIAINYRVKKHMTRPFNNIKHRSIVTQMRTGTLLSLVSSPCSLREFFLVSDAIGLLIRDVYIYRLIQNYLYTYILIVCGGAVWRCSLLKVL